MKYYLDYSIEELEAGYYYDGELFKCIHCDAVYEDGNVYKFGKQFKTAEKAMHKHIADVHESSLIPLLDSDKRISGLTEQQSILMKLFALGLSDKEIAVRLDLSASTIRNHRFKLREKERQAKIFLATMRMLNNKQNEKTSNSYKTAAIVEERYAITEDEKKKVLETYFKNGLDGAITQFPNKEKRKIILLQEVMKRFERDKNYSEPEVNVILESVYSDSLSIRRELVEYGFMDCNKDGQFYWVV